MAKNLRFSESQGKLFFGVIFLLTSKVFWECSFYASTLPLFIQSDVILDRYSRCGGCSFRGGGQLVGWELIVLGRADYIVLVNRKL